MHYRFLQAQALQIDQTSYDELAKDLEKIGVGIKEAANILEIPRSRFYRRDRSSDTEGRSNPDTQKVIEAIKSVITIPHMAIIDRFDRSIIGYEINSRCRAVEWLWAFDNAIKPRFPDGSRDQGGLILQVDNGCQPTSKKFIETVKLCNVDLIYSAYTTPEHNAHIERFLRTLKEEENWYNLYESYSEAVTSIEVYIDFYNNDRIHSALGYLTPAEYYRQSILLKAA